MVEPEDSFIASMGGAIAWIFAPLGFGEWQAVAASISGFVAKEAIVSTIGVLIGVGELAEDDASLWAATMGMFQNPMAAFSFLVFNLLDPQMVVVCHHLPERICLCHDLYDLSVRACAHHGRSLYGYDCCRLRGCAHHAVHDVPPGAES